MVSDELKQLIQSNYSLILQRKQLQTRGGQKRMIAEIARSIAAAGFHDDESDEPAEPAICVVEAGTGTGKTLAYLLAALPAAMAQGKQVVIATATVALQEQVLYKDIPDLLLHSDLQFTFALAKGRGRYLCLSRLDAAMRSNSSADALRDLFQVEVQDPATMDHALYEKLLERLGSGDWQGDRDDWPQSISDEQWRPVAVEQGQCSGNRCSYFSTCCYFRNRDKLQKTDCVVANHDLVLADLALGGGVILPAPQDSIYIFDEAHQLPGKSINHFSHSLRCSSTGTWLEQFGSVMLRIAQDGSKGKGKLGELLIDARDHCHSARQRLQEVFVLLQQYMERAESASARGDVTQFVFPRGVIDGDLCGPLDALAAEFATLSGRLGRIVDVLKQCMEEEDGEVDRQQAESWYPLFGSAQTRSEAAAICCLHMSRNDAPGAAPKARWLTFSEGGNMPEIMLSASPVLAADDLHEHLWSVCHAAVLTSATLTALGSFDFLAQRCGLPASTVYHRIPSPFDYREAARLRLPRKGFDPSDSAGHTAAIVGLLPELLQQDKGALVLFSSRRQMNEVLAGVPTAFRKLVLSQDDYPKQELLRLHRETIDKGSRSIVFGLASLAEGIDLPGDYCTHVVIAKIPFPVPNDPVDATLGEWVKAQGRNPFQEISVPEAALRLIQASGRLLRKESDTGTITILDERLLTRPYGRAILDSLPPYEREVF
jgi:ATP-dependent DNA helicase DinG